jgi:hypothetical protein
VFGIRNQQDFIVKLMQGGMNTILAGYKILYSMAAGSVCPIGGTMIAVVTFGANFMDRPLSLCYYLYEWGEHLACESILFMIVPVIRNNRNCLR